MNASPIDHDLLGVRPSAVYRAAQGGRATRGRWERLLTAGEAKLAMGHFHSPIGFLRPSWYSHG